MEQNACTLKLPALVNVNCCFPSEQSIVTSRKRQREVTASQLDNELKSGGSSVSADSDVIEGKIMEMTNEFSKETRDISCQVNSLRRKGID